MPNGWDERSGGSKIKVAKVHDETGSDRLPDGWGDAARR